VLGCASAPGGRGGLPAVDADTLLVLARVLELDSALDGGKHGVIAAHAGPGAAQERHPALPHDDRTGGHELPVAGLDAQPLADAVAAVLRAGARLLVGHARCPSWFDRSSVWPRPSAWLRSTGFGPSAPPPSPRPFALPSGPPSPPA